jgi:hypothetical protein
LLYVHCITESVTHETAREVNGDKRLVAVSLVTSKARVSPLRTESIFKLQLASCVIAVGIGNGVAQAYGLNPKKMSVTQQIPQLVSFGPHLLSTLQNLTPADIPTRLPKVKDLKNNLKWWNGSAILIILTSDRKVDNVIENKMLDEKVKRGELLNCKSIDLSEELNRSKNCP